MSDIIIPVENFDKIKDSMRTLVNGFPTETASALYLELSNIMDESKAECPVDTGKLRASGHVTDPIIEPGKISASVGYSTNYAVYVHEILENFHEPPTKAKYLEDPVRRNAPNLPQRIIERANSIITGGA